MDKPYIVCHMETSLDGKIMGKFLWIPETNTEEDSFFAAAFGKDSPYHFDSIINGRTTVEDNRTFYKKPELKEGATVPEGDYIAPGAALGHYYFAVDSHGRIAWESNTADEGNFQAHVVEVLTERAPDTYKAFLREKGISYLICGKETVDLPLLADKMKNILHVKELMLGGGGTLNWSFIQAGLVDEVSQVIAPAADGNTSTQTLFMAKEGFSKDQPVVFTPIDVKIMKDNAVWIRWKVGKKNTYDFDNDPDYKAVKQLTTLHS